MSAVHDPRSPHPPVLAPDPAGRSGVRGWTARHPLTAFLLLVFGVGWPVMAVPALAAHGVLPWSLPTEPFTLSTTLLVMLPAALAVTWAVDGRAGVRALLARSVRWRFGAGWWAAILLALPVTTLALGVSAGRSVRTADLASVLGGGLLSIASAALIIHIWEETVWAGFLQTRLERRHGLLVAAALTAVPFGGIHVPLLFVGDFSASSVLVGVAALVGLGVVMRLMVGVVLRATADSLLAAGIVHAVFNGSNNEGSLVDDLLSGSQPTVFAVGAAALFTVVTAVAVRRRLGRGFRAAQAQR